MISFSNSLHNPILIPKILKYDLSLNYTHFSIFFNFSKIFIKQINFKSNCIQYLKFRVYYTLPPTHSVFCTLLNIPLILYNCMQCAFFERLCYFLDGKACALHVTKGIKSILFLKTLTNPPLPLFFFFFSLHSFSLLPNSQSSILNHFFDEMKKPIEIFASL